MSVVFGSSDMRNARPEILNSKGQPRIYVIPGTRYMVY